MSETSLKSATAANNSGFSHDLLVATLDAVSDAVIVVCDQGTVRFCSSGAETLFGYSLAELFGSGVSKLIPKLANIEQFLPAKNGEPVGRSWAFGAGQSLLGKSRAGELIHLHVSMGEFDSSESRMYVVLARTLESNHSYCTASSIDREQADTESRRLLRELHGVFQSVVLDELTTSVAHVVNQPLAAIATYADACRRMLESSESNIETLGNNLEKISTQAIRAGDAISKIRNRVPRSFFTSDVVFIEDVLLELTEIIETEVHDAGGNLTLEIEGGLPAVQANSVHLQHVVLLLLRNSLESRECSDGAVNDVLISARSASDNHIELAVTDLGQGIDCENLGSVDFPFTSDKTERAGLGLSVCKSIIAKHKGHLRHEISRAGTGRFLFELPTVGE